MGATRVKMLQSATTSSYLLLLLPFLLLPPPSTLRSSSFSTTTKGGDDILDLFFSSRTFQAFLFSHCNRRLAEQQGKLSGRAILQTGPPDGAAGEGAGGEAEGA